MSTSTSFTCSEKLLIKDYFQELVLSPDGAVWSVPGLNLNRLPPLPVSREIAICLPVGITAVESSGSVLSEGENPL